MNGLMQLDRLFELLSQAAAPTSAAGITYALFAFAERVASPAAKVALTRRLTSLDPGAAPDLYKGAREIINRIFGEKHFTVRCFLRSALFSFGSIFVIGILYLLIHGRDEGLEDAIRNAVQSPLVMELGGLTLIVYTSLSIIPDYLNLYKTRVVVRWLGAIRKARWIYLPSLLIADFVFGLILFEIIYNFILSVGAIYSDDPINEGASWYTAFANLFAGVELESMWNIATFEHYTSILFYAGMVPSMWLWIAVGSVFLTRLIAKSTPVVNFSVWFLDINEAPYRSVGVIASVCVFFATLIGMAAHAIAKLV
jgi:hypothetical protein